MTEAPELSPTTRPAHDALTSLDDVAWDVALAEHAGLPDCGATHEVLTDAATIEGERHWGEERIANALTNGPLRALRILLEGPWSGASRVPSLEDVFTAEARIRWKAEDFVDEPVTRGVVQRRWILADAVEEGSQEWLDPKDWHAELADEHTRTRRVRWAVVKPAQVVRTPDGVEVLLKWRWNRELPSGALRHDAGLFRSTWSALGEDTWRCRELRPESDCTTLASEAPHFVDATLPAFVGTQLDPRLPQRAGHRMRGVALEDLDRDGDLDLVLTPECRFLYNRGDGTFEDRTEAVLATPIEAIPHRGGAGVLVADFDCNGERDVLLARRGASSLVCYQRAGVFHPTSLGDLVPDGAWTSLAAHDVDRDGFLDVFVCGYGPFLRIGPDEIDDASNGTANRMLRGLPERGFEDVTERWGVDAASTRWSFAAAFGDPDEDGDFDLYVANDFGPNVLYENQGTDDVRFVARLEDPEHVDPGFSMSATWADLDGDLDLDLYVSNMSSTAASRVRGAPGDPREREGPTDFDDLRRRMSKGNTLLRNEGGALTESEGHGASDAHWAWGTALFDYDADGDLDIHCSNGFWSRGSDDGRDL